MVRNFSWESWFAKTWFSTGCWREGKSPTSLGLGAGAESRIPMGRAEIGGLVMGSALTLFVVSAMCAVLASKKEPSVQKGGR